MFPTLDVHSESYGPSGKAVGGFRSGHVQIVCMYRLIQKNTSFKNPPIETGGEAPAPLSPSLALHHVMISGSG